MNPLLIGAVAIALLGSIGLAYSEYKTQEAEEEYVEEHDTEAAEEIEEELQESNPMATLGATLRSIPLVPVIVLSPVFDALPPAWRIYHKVTRWGIWHMQKAANASKIANVRLSGGGEDLLPADYVESDETDKERSGYQIKGVDGKRWDPNGHSERMGKAEIIHVNEDDPDQATWAQTALEEAINAGREKYLFADADLTVTIDGTEMDHLLSADSPTDAGAIPDGGVSQLPRELRHVTVDKPGVLHDALVPLASPDGYEGTVVSWSKYSQLKDEKGDQSRIREAKNQAWTAKALEDVDKSGILKKLLLLAGWSALLLFHEDIGSAIAGFGGGGAVSSAADSATGGLGMLHLTDLALTLGVL